MRVINWFSSITCTKWLFLIYTGFVFEKYFSVCSFLLTRSESAGSLLGSGRNRILIFFFLIRIRPEPDPDFFFISRSGRIRISDKNGSIRSDPDPDSESGTSLVFIQFVWPCNLTKFSLVINQAFTIAKFYEVSLVTAKLNYTY